MRPSGRAAQMGCRVGKQVTEFQIFFCAFFLTLFRTRVPHPFAFCAKGWAALTSRVRLETLNWVGREMPTLAQKNALGWGAISCGDSSKMPGGPPAETWEGHNTLHAACNFMA
jgi:hypothetical protein